MYWQGHHAALMSRRRILASFVAVGMVAGCSSLPTPSQLAMDAQLLINGMAALYGALTGAGINIPADVLANVTSAINAVQNNAQAVLDAIAAGMKMTDISSVFTALVKAVNALTPIIGVFIPAAGPIGLAITAAVTLVQIILGEAGVFSAALKPRALAPGDADQARQILRNAAANGLQP